MVPNQTAQEFEKDEKGAGYVKDLRADSMDLKVTVLLKPWSEKTGGFSEDHVGY